MLQHLSSLGTLHASKVAREIGFPVWGLDCRQPLHFYNMARFRCLFELRLLWVV